MPDLFNQDPWFLWEINENVEKLFHNVAKKETNHNLLCSIFHGTRLRSFCVILQTNKQTNKHRWELDLGDGGINRVNTAPEWKLCDRFIMIKPAEQKDISHTHTHTEPVPWLMKRLLSRMSLIYRCWGNSIQKQQYLSAAVCVCWNMCELLCGCKASRFRSRPLVSTTGDRT